MRVLRWAAFAALLALAALALGVWPELRAAQGGRERVVDRVAP